MLRLLLDPNSSSSFSLGQGQFPICWKALCLLAGCSTTLLQSVAGTAKARLLPFFPSLQLLTMLAISYNINVAIASDVTDPRLIRNDNQGWEKPWATRATPKLIWLRCGYVIWWTCFVMFSQTMVRCISRLVSSGKFINCM